jgi:DNA-binding XRE family transcriptional regulator
MGELRQLRARRLECSLTQGELASRAGVSRQLIAAVEAGRNSPAVDTALRLAAALGTTVEALFVPAPSTPLPLAVDGTLPDGALVRAGRVGDQLVAAAVADHGIAGSGWARPDGVIDRGALRLFPGTDTSGLVLAGCDPAFGVAERILAGTGERSLLALPAPTGTALAALTAGRVHAAVVHGLAGELPAPPLPVARWHVAHWPVGLALPPRRAGRTLANLIEDGVPVIQRSPAAASQHAFERAVALAGLEPPAPRFVADGHLEAARLAALRRSAAITTEGAAHAFALPFLALETHTVEVWVSREWLAHPGVDALGELLSSAAFTAPIAAIGGYDLSGCGDRLG